MPTFLLDHMPGCTPVSPCTSCEAASFLRSKLSEADFRELLAKIKTATTGKPPFSNDNPIPLEAPISVLDLTVRANICLEALKISDIGSLVKKTETELLIGHPNFGRRSLNEIKEKLAGVGRHLGEIV